MKSKTEELIAEARRDENFIKEYVSHVFDNYCAYISELAGESERDKLTDFEYDLIETLVSYNYVREDQVFHLCGLLNSLQEAGHFKGVNNTKQTIGQLMDTCEVQ